MKRIAIVCGLCMLCTACGIYQSHWDCPPGKGIGCKPVTEVLDMIVEKEQGEDLFVVQPEERRQLKERQKKPPRPPVVLRGSEDQKLYLLKEHAGEPVVVEGYAP